MLVLSAEACFFFLGRQAASPLATLVQTSCERGPRQILLLNLDTHEYTSAALVSLHAAAYETTCLCLPSHGEVVGCTDQHDLDHGLIHSGHVSKASLNASAVSAAYCQINESAVDRACKVTQMFHLDVT